MFVDLGTLNFTQFRKTKSLYNLSASNGFVATE